MSNTLPLESMGNVSESLLYRSVLCYWNSSDIWGLYCSLLRRLLWVEFSCYYVCSVMLDSKICMDTAGNTQCMKHFKYMYKLIVNYS